MANDNSCPHSALNSEGEIVFKDLIEKEYPHLRDAQYSDQFQLARNCFAFGWNAGIDNGKYQP